MGGAHYSGFGDTLLTISRIGECPVWSRQFGKSTDSNVPQADPYTLPLKDSIFSDA